MSRCKFLVDVSRFSPYVINLSRFENICGSKKFVAKSRARVFDQQLSTCHATNLLKFFLISPPLPYPIIFITRPDTLFKTVAADTIALNTESYSRPEYKIHDQNSQIDPTGSIQYVSPRPLRSTEGVGNWLPRYVVNIHCKKQTTKNDSCANPMFKCLMVRLSMWNLLQSQNGRLITELILAPHHPLLRRIFALNPIYPRPQNAESFRDLSKLEFW